MPNGFSRTQIALHWAIFVLIALQFLGHEAIAAAWQALARGEPVAFDPLIAAHVAGGALVLALVLWRIGLRLTRGVPPLPAEEPAPLRLTARAAHLGLYALMVLIPATGIAAWFGGIRIAGEAHETLFLGLVGLVALHVLGALYQQFVLRTDVLARMRRPG